MSYITVDELRKPPFSIPESQLDGTYAELILGMTKDLIDRACRQDFLKEGDTGSEVERRHNGSGLLTLQLDKRIVSLKEIKVYTTESSFTTFTDASFNVKPYFIDWKVYSGETRRLLVDNFPEGEANIGVVGIWGYAEVPPMIKYLQGIWVKEVLEKGSMAVKKDSENIGDYSYSLREVENAITGNAEIDMIIKHYTRWPSFHNV